MLRKIGWRLDLLNDPARYLAAQGQLDRIENAALRREVQADAGALPLVERLRLAWPFEASRPDLRYFLERRLRVAQDGEPYFDLGDDQIFFRPEAADVDDAAVITGALTIINEAYVQRPSFFSGPVRLWPGDVVVDLGGNLGTSALLFARLVAPGGRVYSFEPIFAELLRRNLEHNGAEGVEVVPEAVGAAPGEAEFSVSDLGIDSRLTAPGATGRRLRVPMTTLDEFAARRGLTRLDLVKLDIEGAEELALRGGAEVLERLRPKLTIASYHTDPEGDPQHPKLVRLLRAWGYELEEVPGHHIYAWPREA